MVNQVTRKLPSADWIAFGLAVLVVAVFAIRYGIPNDNTWYLPTVGGIFLLLVVLAFAVRRWPFATGVLLSLLAVIALGDSIYNAFTYPSQNIFIFLSIAVQALIFCGVTGVSLVMSGREDTA